MTIDKLADLLETCIKKAIRQNPDEPEEFEWDTFFKFWFRKHGKPCFFLFKKNLGVTNTQYVELFALLETHCKSQQVESSKKQILFQTTEQLKAMVLDTVNILLDVPPQDRDAQIKKFAYTYREVFESTFAIDMFYCSCAVFAPPGMSIDLEKICSDSGYIHSVGHSIYIRNIRKARQKDFMDGLSEYLSGATKAHLPFPFVVYAHEDFDDSDSDAKDEITRGIDGTKLYIEKMSMGSNRLAQIINEMRQSFRDSLEIPPAGSFKKYHKFKKSQAIWLIGDRSIAPINPLNPGAERYYICYQQFYKNDSPFFYFDENKPAWKSHTTMPHSLTAALLNATRPHQSDTVICDPFGGTGTTWFEVKRIGLQAKVYCSDRSPIMKLLLLDNLQFFLLTSEQLATLDKRLQGVLKDVKRNSKRDVSQIDLQLSEASDEKPGFDLYAHSVRLLQELKDAQPGEDQEFNFSTDFSKKLHDVNFTTRLIFYVALRAELRFQGGIKRKGMTFANAFLRSLQEIINQTKKLVELRDQMNKKKAQHHGNILTFRGTYSTEIVPALITKDQSLFNSEIAQEIAIRDACELEPNTLDVIVCDPPYGFNTTEDRADLADLYSKFINSALLALREHGHLIICLPAESYTGRDLPYCTYSKLVLNQVMVKARRLGKHVFLPGRSLPNRMLLPPYYWEAERALRRVILHFQVSASVHKSN